MLDQHETDLFFGERADQSQKGNCLAMSYDRAAEFFSTAPWWGTLV